MRSYALRLRDTTDLLYSSARDRGRRGMLWATLTGRSRCLLALEEVRQGSHVSTTEQSRLHAETRLVQIAQIVGSEGRCADFDCDFNPLHDHNRGRWLRIATANRRGTPLPPVDLVQVGDLYFVQDGHHRISVARALGQKHIEARVTVWHVSGPLPWDTRTTPSTQTSSKPFPPNTLTGRLRHEFLNYVRTLQSNQKGVREPRTDTDPNSMPRW
ncbi:MAG TPA: hypothetical protein VLY63_27270 [Anaerolineae bacterium]|nr:hypothetical protein [Anaerolineae bacterium]